MAAHSASSTAGYGDLAPDDPRHGSSSSYTNHGCRCDPCRAAMSVDQRVWRQRQREWLNNWRKT